MVSAATAAVIAAEAAEAACKQQHAWGGRIRWRRHRRRRRQRGRGSSGCGCGNGRSGTGGGEASRAFLFASVKNIRWRRMPRFFARGRKMMNPCVCVCEFGRMVWKVITRETPHLKIAAYKV